MRYLVRYAIIVLSILSIVNISMAAEMPGEQDSEQQYVRPKTVAVITFATLPKAVKDNQWITAL